MPLPINGTPWPPTPFDVAYQQLDTYDAWYTGDTDRLTNAYQTHSRPAYRIHGVNRTGGLVGAVQSFFWGKPLGDMTRRPSTRLHAPLAANMARLSSELLFAEPPTLTLPNQDAAQARLDLIMNSDETHATLLDAAEIQAALGGVALTLAWDNKVSDKPWFQTSGADLILPEFQAGRTSAITMWTEYTEQNTTTVYRHLERHAIGGIEHALYQGTATSIGTRIPLQERPETEYLAKLVNADSIIITNIPHLTAAYIPNAAARQWRKIGTLMHLGRSDYESQDSFLDALDETWSSWMRDIRLGKARAFVAAGMLDHHRRDRDGNEVRQGASFDDEAEFFTQLPGMQPGKGLAENLSVEQFKIRVDEHARTTEALSTEVLHAAGYSLSDYDEYGDGAAKTATEVSDRRSMSERTRDRKMLAWKSALGHLGQAALALDGRVFAGKGGGEFDLPAVTAPEQSQTDPLKDSQTLKFLRDAKLISIETGVRMQHPDWDDIRVENEVAAINSEGEIDPTVLGRTPFDSATA